MINVRSDKSAIFMGKGGGVETLKISFYFLVKFRGLCLIFLLSISSHHNLHVPRRCLKTILVRVYRAINQLWTAAISAPGNHLYNYLYYSESSLFRFK